MRRFASDADLEAGCRLWQKRLRLQDWHVRVRTRPSAGWDRMDDDGECRITDTLKHAVITIRDSLDSPRDEPTYDQEKTLVHELLHLHTHAFAPKPGTGKAMAHEQAVEILSSALVELARAVPAPTESPA